uniref:Uncharacterized protein n=1 Tax=Candidatus Kentrum sp. LFY TaxID=2126342 RepID=A0A450VCA9_9GAMM|nr:MAG: hypothetical protein BECKLFY1418A_GA0070994_11981 [Candidatus Kentron sp. LFY]
MAILARCIGKQNFSTRELLYTMATTNQAVKPMSVTTLEKEILQELGGLSQDAKQEVLDFTLLIKRRWRTIGPEDRQNHTAGDWRQFVGALKGSPNLRGDPVTIAREMRDEWG